MPSSPVATGALTVNGMAEYRFPLANPILVMPFRDLN
jgi:hypothetical protein